ncbi:MAG: DUF723 domain-containing protein [Sulfuricurvum sp.]
MTTEYTTEYIEEHFLTKSLKLKPLVGDYVNIEKLYLIYYRIEKPTCSEGKSLKFLGFSKGYYSTCSDRKCICKKKNITFSREFLLSFVTKNSNLDSNKCSKYNITPKEVYDILYPEANKVCKNGTNLKFNSFVRGYSEECTNIYCLCKKEKMALKRASKTKVTKVIEPRIANLELLTKEYIEINFANEGIIDKESMMDFYKCKINFVNVVLRKYKIKSKGLKLPDILTQEFVDKNLLNKEGKVSKYKLNIYRTTSKEIFMKLNNLSVEPLCLICRDKVKFIGVSKGFNSCCSHNCSNKLKQIKEGTIHSTETLIERSREIHDIQYDLSLVRYTGSQEMISVVCPHHGLFRKKTSLFLSGVGCTKCAYANNHKSSGWSRDRFKNKKTTLYYIRIKGTDLYKIGITSRSLRDRFTKDFSKIEVIHTEEFEDGIEAFDKEYLVLKEFKEFKYKGPKILLNGNTEIFTKNILNL